MKIFENIIKLKNINLEIDKFDIHIKNELIQELLNISINKGSSIIKIDSNLIKILMKNENVQLLDIIFDNLRFFDKELIMKFLFCYKYKKALSTLDLFQLISNDKYKISTETYHTNTCSKYLKNVCKDQNEYLVKFLINCGAPINESVDELPLIISCTKGNEPIVKYLIEHGADINKCDWEKNTPLKAAWKNGHKSVIKLLIEHGANINEKMENGNTLLCEACENGHENEVRYLIKHGADINIFGDLKKPLELACENGFENIIKFFIEEGMVKEQDDYDNALYYACKNGNETIVKYLIKHGSNINSIDGSDSPLSIACLKGHINIVKYLISLGADINLGYFNIPLSSACMEGRENIVKYLVEHGADVNKIDFDDYPPFLYSCRYINIAKYLLEHGAIINETTYNNTLYFAKMKPNNEKMVNFLKENKEKIISNM